MTEMYELQDDIFHKYSYCENHSQIYIENCDDTDSVWITKEDLIDMLKLFEEKETN